MNLSELVDEVELVLHDTSFTDSIPDWINSAIAQAIDDANVPGFKSIITVDTVLLTAYASLPATCSGRILYAGDGQDEIPVVALDELMECYPDFTEAGDVETIAIEGSLLYYQKIPSEVQTLTLLHRRKPAVLALDTDIPEGIPEHLHRAVIVPKAAINGFDMIEDGIEGEKVNTVAQTILYNKGLFSLREWVAKRIKHRTRSIWSC
jgi:hypothetical protein